MDGNEQSIELAAVNAETSQTLTEQFRIDACVEPSACRAERGLAI